MHNDNIISDVSTRQCNSKGNQTVVDKGIISCEMNKEIIHSFITVYQVGKSTSIRQHIRRLV